jgi:hypothetical protein
MKFDHYIAGARLEACPERGRRGLGEAVRAKQRIRRLPSPAVFGVASAHGQK